MKKDESLCDYIVLDLLGDIPNMTRRAMFGGWGIYRDGLFFALIADGELYFKVDEQTRKTFEQIEGSKPFTYSRSEDKPTTMS